MERGTENAKKEAKEQVPSDRVKDAPAVARELRWRVRLANGYVSDEDSKPRRKAVLPTTLPNAAAAKKRKRSEDGETDRDDGNNLFLHFKPKPWDAITARPAERESKVLKAHVPPSEGGEWTKEWEEWEDLTRSAEDAPEAMVEQRRDVIVKVRRTDKGLERQRVERVLESWTWEADSRQPVLPPDQTTHVDVPNGTETVKSEEHGQLDVVMDVDGTATTDSTTIDPTTTDSTTIDPTTTEPTTTVLN